MSTGGQHTIRPLPLTSISPLSISGILGSWVRMSVAVLCRFEGVYKRIRSDLMQINAPLPTSPTQPELFSSHSFPSPCYPSLASFLLPQLLLFIFLPVTQSFSSVQYFDFQYPSSRFVSWSSRKEWVSVCSIKFFAPIVARVHLLYDLQSSANSKYIT